MHDFITLDLAKALIARQFPHWAHLSVIPVEKQGHDNRTFRLGQELLIRMPTAAKYASKVPLEQRLLPELEKRLSVAIPSPVAIGSPEESYPYRFSIYQMVGGKKP